MAEKTEEGELVRVIPTNVKNFRMVEVIEVPHMGQVGAGSTVDLFDFRQTMKIPRPAWAVDAAHVATAEVCGDSLLHEGILNRDILICQMLFDKGDVTEGKLVIATTPLSGSMTKRIHFAPNMVILRSSNPKYKDLYFDPADVKVEAIVRELFRNLD